MPRRKSDAAEGESQKAPDTPADDAAPEPSPPLSTPDEAAEPGSPDTTGAPPEAADPYEAIEPYRDPEIVTPEVVAAEERAAADEPELFRAAETVEESHEPEEEAGGSLASKVLVGLVLLLLGAGLALWGAPKLARHLPSGMAGVADWLTPGVRDAEARIADLEARLGERLGGVEARLTGLASGDDVDARVGAAVDAAATRLDGEIAAVKESVEQLGTSDAPQQLARLQSALEGQGAELATLKEQLSGAEATTGQLSEEAVARIDVYRAELDGLRAEVGTLQDRVAGLTAEVGRAVQNAEREIEFGEDAGRDRPDGSRHPSVGGGGRYQPRSDPGGDRERHSVRGSGRGASAARRGHDPAKSDRGRADRGGDDGAPA